MIGALMDVLQQGAAQTFALETTIHTDEPQIPVGFGCLYWMKCIYM